MMNFFNRLFGKKSEPEAEDKEETNPIDWEKEYERSIAVLKQYKRTAYLPVTEDSDRTFSAESKIGGFPYLRNEQDWPICPNCKKHMQLFLQLNLEELPERQDQGLVQLFYCMSQETNCESELEAFFPFSKAVCCRKIEISGEPVLIQPETDVRFDEKLIVGWIPKDDYPHFEEYESLGVDLELDDDVYELMEERGVGLPIGQDKLFGWPYWVQAEEYPYDRKTGSKMELLFQLGSEDNLPYMFGDAGIGHLTQSPDNDKELAFGWACS